MKFSLLILVLSYSAFSAEVDQFTRRDEELIDASKILNTRAQLSIEKSLKNLNATDRGCDESALYKELRSEFGNHIKGEFTKYVIENNDVPRRHIPISESVYKDWNSYNGFILGSPIYRKSGIALSDLVKVGDKIIGTDKFEHLFGRGFHYFKNTYIKNKTIEKTLTIGATQEKLVYGGLFIETGVFSYADLSANFNGMRFWNHVLLKDDDILGSEHNLGPYIVCKNKKWIQNAEIDFRNYVDNSFDESVNCSKFSVDSSVEKYRAALTSLNASCGLKTEDRALFMAKYGRFASWIINTNGNKKVNYKGELGE